MRNRTETHFQEQALVVVVVVAGKGRAAYVINFCTLSQRQLTLLGIAFMTQAISQALALDSFLRVSSPLLRTPSTRNTTM